MSRFIVNNDADINDWQVIDLVRRVVKAGRISDNGNIYCRATVFHTMPRGRVVVVADRTKAGTDTFTIYEEPQDD